MTKYANFPEVYDEIMLRKIGTQTVARSDAKDEVALAASAPRLLPAAVDDLAHVDTVSAMVATEANSPYAAHEASGAYAGHGPYLCSITRVHNEHVKFKSFIRHQLREGFDRVLIVDDRSEPSLEWDDARVEILRIDLKEEFEKMNRAVGMIETDSRVSVDFEEGLMPERSGYTVSK